MKASFISATKTYDGKLKYLIYNYRGYEYMITDYGWYGNGGKSESLSFQHKQEQNRIDKIIEDKNKPQKETNGFDFDYDEWCKQLEEMEV